MPKKNYFTKCFRKFQKSSTAEVTGYKIDLEDTANEECKTCPFRIEVKKEWPEVFDHWECRAGSDHPNNTNDWLGNSDDKTSLRVMSLDHEYLTNVIVYCETHDDITAVSYIDDLKDCRRCLSIGFVQNKKGIAAKQKFLKLFFDVEVPEKDTRTRKERIKDKVAELTKCNDEQALSESKRTHYDKWDKRNNQELIDRYLGQNDYLKHTIESLAEWFCVSEDMIRDQLKTLNIAEPTLLNPETSQLKNPEEFTSIHEKMDDNTFREKLQVLFKAGKSLCDLSEIMGKDWIEILKLLREMKEDPSDIESAFIELNQKRTYELSKINKNFQIGITPAMLDDIEWKKVLNNAELSAKKNPIKEGGSMFNEEFEAVLKSVSSKTAYKQIDGMRTKESAYKIVVESCDIDYESVEKDMPSVYAYLTAMKDQLTFKTIGFGAVPVMDLSLEMRGMTADGEFEYSARELGLAKITNMSITAKYNIPYYMFVIEISDEVSGTYLLRNLKSAVKIKFNKPQSLFESVEIKES